MDPSEILSFWFGTLDDAGLADDQHAQRWWRKDPAFDAEVRARFLTLWNMLTRETPPPTESPQALLATVLVLDQFSRNMFRDQARAFSADAQALSLVHAGLRRGDDRKLIGQERVFLYMPLMHSERLEEQERCVALFAAFRDETEGKLREVLEYNLKFAEQHRVIIARFGRFPHRNQVLGRASTDEEVEFLKQPGSSF